MALHLLDHSFSWWGKHAGFSPLSESLALNGCPTTVVRPRKGIAVRGIGKAYSSWKGLPGRDQRLAAAEVEFLFRMRLSRSKGHVLFLEDHLSLLQRPSFGSSDNWIGTIHLPRRSWKPAQLKLLASTRGIIVLCERMREEFSDLILPSRIRVVPHGVNTAFFYPDTSNKLSNTRRLLFVGAWLRNTQMLSRLVPQILEQFPDVMFDLVVPMFARNDSALVSLRENRSVHWYHGLTDEELRLLYQSATVMLMPMEDSGANNAIVEALACGLPIITTDTGGIRDYGGGTVFPLVANNDDEACLVLVARYLNQPEFRKTIAAACRAFATTKLDWTIAAKEYLNAYRFFDILP
jgi:glycosyltransferase involved in cell wall biosynthesis